MRIAIDMQGAQGAGRHRGIGRYTLALAEGLIRVNTDHEIVLVLNGQFPESVSWLTSHFEKGLQHKNIHVWTAPGPVDFLSGSNNAWRREAAEIVREAFLADIDPDVVLVSSMIEGIGDNCVTSIGKFQKKPKVAAIVYDFIYLLYPDIYLANPLVRRWYTEKLGHLKNADLFLSISESSRREAIQCAQIPAEKIFNISTAVDPKFSPSLAEPAVVEALLGKIGISKPFVFYCGGSDARKNLGRLVSAYSGLPKPLRDSHQLLIVGTIPAQDILALKEHGKKTGLSASELVVSGFLDDDAIIALYS
ncbi:MAG TPA: glycosyltransferase, partial [Burkholderiales bacterium]|nr:glycosyltransferase [Burkholderiales bacterium]